MLSGMSENQRTALLIGAVLVIGLVLVVGVRQFTASKRAEEKSERTATRQEGRSDRTSIRQGGRTQRRMMRRAFRGRKGRQKLQELYASQYS